MDKDTYIGIRHQLDFGKPLWPTLAVIAFDWAMIALAFSIIDSGTIGYVLSQFLIAVFFFHNFALLHECVHGNVSEKLWVNSLFGHYASPFCFLTYFPWRYIHTEHHTWTGNIDKDPVLAHVKRMREQKDVPWIVRFGWKSWVPLSGFFQHFVYWFYPLTMWKEGKMTKKVLARCLFSTVWMFAVYVALFMLFPETLTFANLWLAVVLYLVATEVVNLPHHVSMPTFRTSPEKEKLKLWEQHMTTRSCHYPGFLSEFLTMNFNIHTEHHFFPTLPWYRLKRARTLVKPALNEQYHEVIGARWNLKNRAKSAREVFLTETPFPG